MVEFLSNPGISFRISIDTYFITFYDMSIAKIVKVSEMFKHLFQADTYGDISV